ncbi:hypothetical protein BGZ92_010646 [Podila epicladia]|nr:hypothetical protein BGZ92_010646 [Podila epicladia]
MPVTSQKFQLGSTERELDIVSKATHKPLFVYVDDVLDAFEIPRANRFEADGRTIAYMRDDNGITTPGTLSSSTSVDQLSIKSNILRVLDSSEPMSTTLSRRTTSHIHSQWKTLNAAVDLANRSGCPLNAKAMQELIEKHLVPCINIQDIQQYLVQNVGALVRDEGELKLQGDVIEQLARKMIDMQQQALDRLALIQRYLVREPTEFFKKYGPFLLLMLELIKFGTSVAGHIVPTLASLKVVELADSVKQSVELVVAKIDISLECIDKQLTKVQESSPGDFTSTESRAAMTQQDLVNYLRDAEGLEGVELRQLRSFLKASEEDNLLGNLYRMTTSDGHVKWVCFDHYRAGYQETHSKAP